MSKERVARWALVGVAIIGLAAGGAVWPQPSPACEHPVFPGGRPGSRTSNRDFREPPQSPTANSASSATSDRDPNISLSRRPSTLYRLFSARSSSLRRWCDRPGRGCRLCEASGRTKLHWRWVGLAVGWPVSPLTLFEGATVTLFDGRGVLTAVSPGRKSGSASACRRRGGRSLPRPDCAQAWRRARGRQGQALSGALGARP